MHKNEPEGYTLDLVAGNGKQYRFRYNPRNKSVRYFDRGIVLSPGDTGYGTSDINGHPVCGPAMDPAVFDPAADSGLASYTHDDEYDIDRASVQFVGAWIAHINEYTGS